MEATNIATAQDAFNLICTALEGIGIYYEKHEEDLVVFLGMQGKAGPMTFLIMVNEKIQVINLHSRLPFKMEEEKRVEGALATLTANYGMANGCFDYDFSDGTICFRISTAFGGSRISEDVILYMIHCAGAMVERYSPQFLAINDGTLSLSDFIANDQ